MDESQATLPESTKETDFAARVAELRPQLEALFEKYQITLGAKLNYLPDAIVPSPTYIDTKPVEKKD